MLSFRHTKQTSKNVADTTFQQLAKQLPTLKTLMQKILHGLCKKFTFSISSLLKLNFSTTVFGTTQLCTSVFRTDTGNIEKLLILHIVAFMPNLSN